MAHHLRDDDLVVLDLRDTAAQFTGLNAKTPDLVRCARMDTQCAGRVWEMHTAVGLQEECGCLVACIRTICIASAQCQCKSAGRCQAVVDHRVNVLAGFAHINDAFIGDRHTWENDDVAQPKDEGIGIILSLLHRNLAFFQFFVKKMSDVVINTSHALAVLLCIGGEHDLIKDRSLQAFPVGAGRMLHDPVQTVCHHEQFFFACFILNGFCFLACSFCIAFAHCHGCITDTDHCMIEQEGVSLIIKDLSVHFVDLLLCFFFDCGKTGVDRFAEVANVMSLRTAADAAVARTSRTGSCEHTVAGCFPDLIGHNAFCHLVDGFVFPVLISFFEDIAVCIAHVDGFAALPCFFEVFFIVHDTRDPADTPFYVWAHRTLIRSRTACKDIVIKDIVSAVLCPVEQGTSPLHQRVFVFMCFVILGV